MYQSLAEFLSGFSARFPVLWALLTLAVVTLTSLALYLAWGWIVGGLEMGQTMVRRLWDR
jgi:hypothetical protein